MEEELKELQVEVEELRGKASRLEQENKELKDNEIVMTEEVQRLSSDFADEHASAVNAHEILETEQVEKMRLEQALGDLQEKHNRLQKEYDQLEMEVEDIRLLGHKQFGSDSDEENAEGKLVHVLQKISP
jgi:chromosome segregation ATPase